MKLRLLLTLGLVACIVAVASATTVDVNAEAEVELYGDYENVQPQLVEAYDEHEHEMEDEFDMGMGMGMLEISSSLSSTPILSTGEFVHVKGQSFPRFQSQKHVSKGKVHSQLSLERPSPNEDSLGLSVDKDVAHYATLKPWTTWTQANKYCKSVELVLCKYETLCPKGESGAAAFADELPSDLDVVFSPLRSENDYVVLKGKNVCKKKQNPKFATEENNLGTKKSKSYVACCSTKAQQAKGYEKGIVVTRRVSSVKTDTFVKKVKTFNQDLLKIRFGKTVESNKFAFTQATGGWNFNNHPRFIADVNGDGLGDIVGFSCCGIEVALGKGDGKFETPKTWARDLTQQQGWHNSDDYPRFVVDINKDGKADVVGFGHDCVHVMYSTGSGFTKSECVMRDLCRSQGWTTQHIFPRRIADVDGDGVMDVIGFGYNDVFVAFGSMEDGKLKLAQPKLMFGDMTVTKGGYENNDKFPRYVVDMNGDGKADLVAFAWNHVRIAYSTGTGFKPTVDSLKNFCASNGDWRSFDKSPKFIADFNGDKKPDIIGFSPNGVWASIGDGNGSFQEPTRIMQKYGAQHSWANFHTYPRLVGEINGDNRTDIVAFAHNPVIVEFSLPKEK